MTEPFRLEEISRAISVAMDRIRSSIRKTPLIYSENLSKTIDGEVYLKLENRQYTGSFKARGSLNKLLSLNQEERSKLLITASTGNHGLGFARAVQLTQLNGKICLPANASPLKIKKLKEFDVDLYLHDGDSLATEIYAKELAYQQNAIWVSPYNDIEVIAGQGTIAIEILEQATDLDAVFVTVGGGGLISGIGTYLSQHAPSTQIIACQPENSPEMTLSLEAGEIVHLEIPKETLSDGSAGGIEPGAITFPICQEIIDQSVLVDENQIRHAMDLIYSEHGETIEGSAGVAVASLLKNKEEYQNKKVVVIICGGNVG